jgi:hypothetical protein
MSDLWMPRTRPTGASRPLTERKSQSRASKARRRFVSEVVALEDRTLLSTSIPLNSVQWTQIGPSPIVGTSGAGGTGGSAGRVAGITADPTDPKILYIAAAGGGVWKSSDAGLTWSPKTDTQSTLFMGSITVAPSNHQILYAGTGEANNSGDSFYGRGVLKSTDGGASWTLVGSAPFDRRAIAKIVVSPTDPNLVYAAVCTLAANGIGTGSGIYKSINGGTSWVNSTAAVPPGTLDQWDDVVMDPTNPQVLYAADGFFDGSSANAVYKTTDGGASWNVAGNFPKGVANGRIALAISQSNAGEVVASVAATGAGGFGVKYLLKSSDSGATWNNISPPGNYLGQQGWYDNVAAISPTDPNVIFVAGVGYGSNHIFETRDGGTSWTDLTSDTAGNSPHTDSHAMAFDANGKLLLGNDGGIWRLDNPGPGSTLWTNLNAGLQITQFTGTSLNPTNANIVYGGSQDNGTEKFNDSLNWTQVFGGDGGYTAVDPGSPQITYTENFGVSLARSTDGGLSYTYVTTGISTNDPVNFYAPYTIDPSTPAHLLYGTNRVYSSTDRGNNWTPISTPNANGWNTKATINWITIAPSNSNTIYATTSDGKIFVSTDAGANWTEHDAPAQDSFQQILVDKTSAQTAYIVRNAFDSGGNVGHVFMTTNGGGAWTDISANLPNIPANAVAVDTRPGVNRIYVGNDQGVWASTNGPVYNWTQFKSGMPNAQVVTLELNNTLDVLMAGTHGRGVLEISATDALSILPTAFSSVESVPFSAVQVAKFSDVPILGPVGSYTATIDWGDSTPATNNATITDLGNGFYGVAAGHTYAEEGAYTMRVTVNGTNGHSAVTSFSVVVADAPLTPIVKTVNPLEGNVFSGEVARFSDGNVSANATEFTATIDWGNGVKNTGTVTMVSPGLFSVAGTITYATVASFPISVTVNDSPGIGGNSIVVASTAVVQDAPLSPIPRTVTANAGANFTSAVASFTDADSGALGGNYTVTVNWGDGSPNSTLASGVSVVNSGNRFDVLATHAYKRYSGASPYTITTTVTDNGGATTTVVSTATISDAPIKVSALTSVITEGDTVSGVVGTISSANPFALVSDFSGTTINWGDGSAPDVAVITAVAGSPGKFNVSGSHVYVEGGTSTLVVHAVSVGGSTATGMGTVNAVDATLVAQNVQITAGVAGQPINATVATFTDNYLKAPLTDFTATIDWGDGGPTTTGVVVQPGGVGTRFQVLGSHAYAKAQAGYPVTVLITDVGGSTAGAQSSVDVADAPITISPAILPTIGEGQSSGGIVATFSNNNSLSTPADFIASIDWGDGTSTIATLTADANVGIGGFDVTTGSPHNYAEEGFYTVKVLVISLGGSRNNTSTTAIVSDAPISGSPIDPTVPIATVAGTNFNGAIATFTENPRAPLSDFTVSIDWGDQSSSAGVVSARSDGSFGVAGSHVYRQFGNYTANVTVTDVGGSTSTFPVTLKASDPALTATGGTPGSLPQGVAVSSVAGRAFFGTVATFGSPNAFVLGSEFVASINWGDGTPTTGGTVVGAGSALSVLGVHVYANPAAKYVITATINHYNSAGASGSAATATGTAHVLVPVSGAMSRGSDSGASNVDGITNIRNPVFLGKAEPGAIVRVFATAVGSTQSTLVASTSVDGTGNWAVQISPLGDGSYVFTAQMVDPITAASVETVLMPVTPAGSPVFTLDTVGPTVSSVRFDPASGSLVVDLKSDPAGFNPAALANPGNYLFGPEAGLFLAPIGVKSLHVSPANAAGVVEVVVTYNTSARLRPGPYVVSLNAVGLADRAGNILVEKNLVTFPQASNSPNPNYVAQIDVTRGGAASAPHFYVPLPEQIAAHNYSNNVQKNKVVRVPRTSNAQGPVTSGTTSVPKPSKVSGKRKH